MRRITIGADGSEGRNCNTVMQRAYASCDRRLAADEQYADAGIFCEYRGDSIRADFDSDG